MEPVYIRRQFNDWRIAEVPLSKLSEIGWSSISGGVKNISPQPFISAYVWCDEVNGDIAHSCKHGPPPHHIKVVILKMDNDPDVYVKINNLAGPRPHFKKAKPYYPEKDAGEICDALIQGNKHKGIEFKNHKKHGEMFVIKPKRVERLIKDGTDNTVRNRSKKLISSIREKLNSSNLFEEISYGRWLTYRKKKNF